MPTRSTASGADTIHGGGGDDILRGSLGSDVLLDGDAGVDTLGYGADSGRAGNVTMTLDSSANGTMTSGEGAPAETDTIESIETLEGSSGDDSLSSAMSGATIRGLGGDDTLMGSAGPEAFDGGGGTDIVSFDDGFHAGGVYVDLQAGDLPEVAETFTEVEGVTGTPDPDQLSGDALANPLDGGAGDDVLAGRAGDDPIVGGGGSDQISGDADQDTVTADDGEADTIDCGSETDSATYDPGLDSLSNCEVPPAAIDDSATVSEDAAATAVDVLANDSDPGAVGMQIQSVTQPAHGTSAITNAGAGLTYAPAANYCGADSFTYTLNGGSTGTVSVTVTCVDDSPVAVNDSKTVAEDASATTVNVLANDTDIDAGPKSVVSKTNGAHGTVTIPSGGANVTYRPAANYCGADSFTYTLNGGSTGAVSVTVTCVDDDPVAVNDSKTVAEDANATTVDVLANDTDIDAGPKSVASKTNGANGTVTIGSGGTNVSYAPAANFCGSDSFTYTLSPGGSTATVSVTVTCVDDNPVAVNDSKTVAEDANATTVDVLANDTDIDAGPKSVASKTNGAHGTVTIGGGGANVSYAPAANYCGADSFTYTLNGGSTGTVSVAVTCVDDNPAAVNDAKTVTEDGGATALDVLANDTDIDAGPKSVASKTNGAHGAVTVGAAGANVTYAPVADYCGADSFTYTLNGGSTATVAVTVTCVEDAATAVDDAATVAANSSGVIEVRANDVDPDPDKDLVASKTNGAHGAVAIAGGGANVSYTPAANYCGADSFTYTLTGGSSATVSVTVTCPGEPGSNPPPGPAPADSTPPDTEITKAPKAKLKTKRAKPTVAFGFASTEAGSSFECRLDAGSFVPCVSPQTYKLKRGRHTFEVRAVDAANNRDASAATFTLKVVRKKKR